MLQNKKIVLGVTGSIAAYKAALLVRLFIKNGAEVKVVMTNSATNFITPLTLSTLSKNIVFTDNFDAQTGKWNNHVELAKWADFMLISPASANTIAKLANGICDNLLCAVYLSAQCPVFVAPAMDLDMYNHKSTINNIEKLIEYDCKVIQAEYGELASGLTGEGRMAEPENIVKFILDYFNEKKKLKKTKVLVSAGPTQEMIDPVRYIGNHSSGKMGIAIANEFYDFGADVTLIAGPIEKHLLNKKINTVNVVSAEQMYDECIFHSKNNQIIVMAAAVADYTPIKFNKSKLKKNESELTIELTKTKDILKTIGENRNPNQIVVGFALENENETENAINKLKSKNLDLIVLNSLNDENAGFNSDFNKITIIDKKLNQKKFELKPKTQVATDIINEIVKLIKI